jgi:hypothetical protein
MAVWQDQGARGAAGGEADREEGCRLDFHGQGGIEVYS